MKFVGVIWGIVFALFLGVSAIVHYADNPDAAANAELLYLPVIFIAAISGLITIVAFLARFLPRL